MIDVLYIFVGAVALALFIAVPVVNWLKGKRWMAFWGVVAFPIGVLYIAAIVTTIRVAKPDSWWARRYYGEGSDLMRRSRERFYA